MVFSSLIQKFAPVPRYMLLDARDELTKCARERDNAQWRYGEMLRTASSLDQNNTELKRQLDELKDKGMGW